MARTRRARRISRALHERYPYAHCELDFETPLQLLLATVLSAQTTDVLVNSVTPTLFSRWPTAEALAGADRDEMEAVALNIRELLVEQVTGMVRWRESVSEMVAAGVTEFVELGGKVLGPMVKRIAPDARITSVVTIEDVEALAKEIA